MEKLRPSLTLPDPRPHRPEPRVRQEENAVRDVALPDVQSLRNTFIRDALRSHPGGVHRGLFWYDPARSVFLEELGHRADMDAASHPIGDRTETGLLFTSSALGLIVLAIMVAGMMLDAWRRTRQST